MMPAIKFHLPNGQVSGSWIQSKVSADPGSVYTANNGTKAPVCFIAELWSEKLDVFWLHCVFVPNYVTSRAFVLGYSVGVTWSKIH